MTITDAEHPRGFKSRRSPQGIAVALFKDCNAVLDPLGRSLYPVDARSPRSGRLPSVASALERAGKRPPAVLRL